MNKKSIFRTLITYLLLMAIAIFALTTLTGEKTREMTYTELLQKIEAELQ